MPHVIDVERALAADPQDVPPNDTANAHAPHVVHTLLAPYANLKDAQLRQFEAQGKHTTFLCESELVVRALLASRWPIHSILCTSALLAKLQDALAAFPATNSTSAPARAHDFPILLASEQRVQALAGFAFHRGVLAAGLRVPSPSLDVLIARSRTLLVLEGISNHDNIGAIFRNAAGLAGDQVGIILTNTCCDPLYRKALRVSVGHVLRVPWHTTSQPIASILTRLRDANVRTIALSPRADALTLAQARASLAQAVPSAPFALLLGAEGPGLSEQAMAHADLLVKIPMAHGVDSLNVATACAIALSWLALPVAASQP